jgi:hypothetical protein
LFSSLHDPSDEFFSPSTSLILASDPSADYDLAQALHFLSWMKQEPQSMVWLPVLHRWRTGLRTVGQDLAMSLCCAGSQQQRQPFTRQNAAYASRTLYSASGGRKCLKNQREKRAWKNNLYIFFVADIDV